MIVVCSTCQARFKVADEKIGPRGAKVRCSKCQTVFIVHRELGVMPAEGAAPPPAPLPARPAARRPGPGELDLESEPMGGTRPSGFIADPFARPASHEAQPAAPADPFSMPSPSGPDPFAAPAPSRGAAADPYAAPPPEAAHDPFGGADPFEARHTPTGGASLGAVDPFVATVAGRSPGLPTSAVTDLSDLLGGAGPSGTPLPGSQSPAPTPAPEPSGILDTGFDFDTSAQPEPELEAGPPPSQASAPEPEPDLALAERTPSEVALERPAPVPMPGMVDFGGADPFSMDAGAAGGPLDFGGPEQDAFGAGPEPAAPPPPAAPLPVAPAENRAPAVATPEAAPSEGADAGGPEEAAVAGLRRRSSRLRAVLINAISLAALLFVAVALLAFWRGFRPGVAGSLVPGGPFGAIRSPESPFTVAKVRSGLYERGDASPVLFVAGDAISRAAAAVSGLRVRVELIRRGAVVAQAEVRAGAVPTPEQLFGSRETGGVAALLERLAAGAPATVKPGDAVPFLVAISEYPPDVAQLGLRVSVEPVGAAPPAKGPPSP